MPLFRYGTRLILLSKHRISVTVEFSVRGTQYYNRNYCSKRFTAADHSFSTSSKAKLGICHWPTPLFQPIKLFHTFCFLNKTSQRCQVIACTVSSEAERVNWED